MSLSVKVQNKEFPDDHVFAIDGLGLFTNGKAREVTKEEEQAFVDARGIAVRDALGGESFDVSGTATAKVPDPPEETTTTEATEKVGE